MSFLLGGFRLDEEIGRGGMGTVHRGLHLSTGTAVAIKIVGAALASDNAFREAFRDEVRAVASLDHPGIVMVFDQGEVDERAATESAGTIARGAPYLVMDLSPHGTLHDVPGDRSWPWLRAVLLGVLDALAHAHARGVIHRDIKPGNVLLGGPEAPAAIKLTDFGIAHRLDDRAATLRHGVTGTPHYMAPEQIEGPVHRLGPWTDLYAVGCLAYRLAGGRPPFWEPRISVLETLRRHQAAPVPPLQSRIPVPEGFGAWLRGMLAKAPERRFRCAADAVAALADLGDPQASSRGEVEAVAVWEESTRLLAVPLEPTQEWASGQGRESPGEPEARRVPVFPASWRSAEAPLRSAALAGAGLALFALRPAPFVGRDRERDALWAAVGAVHAGRSPRLVVVRGPAGVGKTRLGEWLSTRVREVGAATVLSAVHAAVAGAADGLGPMVARLLRTGGLPRPEALEVTRAAVLRLGGDLADAPPLLEITHPRGDGEDDATPRVRFAGPRERHRALVRLVELLARERPVLVRIEDAQWAPDALAFVAELLGEGLPVLCWLGVSEDALLDRPAEAEAIGALAARPQAQTLVLAPLDALDHADLVRGLLGLSPELAAEVRARTSGNPLFAVQLVGDWVQRGILEARDGGFQLAAGADAAIPDDIHALWLRRVTRAVSRPGEDGSADGPALASVERAALLGCAVDAAEWGRAAAVTGLPGPAALAPALELHGLLRREGSAWSFCHGMLVESLARHARAAARFAAHHRACAEALAAASGPGVAGRIAGHLEAAGDHEAALAPAFAAAWERYEASDYQGALNLLDRRDGWIQRLGLPASDARRAWGWMRQALVLIRMVRLHDAAPRIDAAEAAARDHGHHDLLAEALHARAKSAQMAGRASESIALFEEARGRFEAAADRRGVARCDHGIAEMLKQSSGPGQARGRYEAALAGYAESGDAVAHASCRMGLAHLVMAEDPVGGLALLAEAERELGAVGNRLGQAIAALLRGHAERAAGRLDEAEALYWRCATILEAVGSADVVVAKGNVGILHLLRGDFDRATSILEETHASFVATGREGYLVYALIELLPCRAFARDWARFDALCAQAEEILARTGLTDEDMDLCAQLAARLCREAGEEARAERAEAIARAQRPAPAA